MCTKVISAALAICLLYATCSEGLVRIASDLRCQCINKHSNFIHPRLIQNVELIPNGPHCANVEVIITLKTGQVVCVDPSATWVQKIINKILESQSDPEMTNF
ncbi:interleukin-8 [Bombina bombina]|uniref:interleukin-8 n=1 Tax=Bombina bombina TaxID=8345 RepID=UPI00235AA5B9|nr:interleukin-8 [Bombina bombina]